MQVVTILLTKEQAEDLYFSAGMLYQQYDDNAPEYMNETVRRYNNKVDILRQIIKDSIKNNCKTVKGVYENKNK